jgi:hypothetical protein
MARCKGQILGVDALSGYSAIRGKTDRAGIHSRFKLGINIDDRVGIHINSTKKKSASEALSISG